MFKTILVPTDGSTLSDKAVQSAVEFARLNQGKIVALSVAEPYPYSALAEGAYLPEWGTYEKQAQELAQLHVKKVADAARAAQVPCETKIAISPSPYEEIVRAAEEYGCDAIFMASHGRKGLNRLFIGSETQKVLAHTTIPVLVLR
jgi:nucleotide-binding universal stress UspA family protein